MNVLKAVGKGVLKVVQFIVPMKSFADAAIPDGRPQDVFDGIIRITQVVEKLFANLRGPDAPTGVEKLKAALPEVQELVGISEFMANKEVVDEKEFTAAVADLINASVRLQNSVKVKQ